MNYFLDTNTCIHFLKDSSSSIRKELALIRPHQIKISSMVKSELFYGVYKSERFQKNLERITDFLSPFEIIDFDSRSAEFHGEIRAYLEKEGKIIGPSDLIIAATSMAHNGILVTHNAKEFSRVKGLKVEDWI